MARQLNEKQRLFAEHYAKTGNATSSALQAGYEGEHVHQIGYRLVRTPSVAAEIARLRSRLEKKSELNAQRVMDELSKLVFSNVQDLYDDQGNLKPIHELPADVAAAISSVEMSEKGTGVKKLKTHSKLGAIELASKLLGMIREQQNAQASVQIILSQPVEMPERVETAKLLPEWGE